jgi:cutinase
VSVTTKVVGEVNVVNAVRRDGARPLAQPGSVRGLIRCAGAALFAASALLGSPAGAPAASAVPCPDVEIVFARGTFEPPGVGVTGQAFVDALTARLGGRPIDVYPVNYPASLDFATAADGVVDAANKVRDTAANCPNTKVVLGGYSQGAAVIGYITEDKIPDGYTPPPGITGPMPAQTADHVAAIALFGKPSSGFLNGIDRDAPPITVGQRFGPRTIDLCINEDPVCSAAGSDNSAHGRYVDNGMAVQAADFAVHRLASHGAN